MGYYDSVKDSVKDQNNDNNNNKNNSQKTRVAVLHLLKPQVLAVDSIR